MKPLTTASYLTNQEIIGRLEQLRALQQGGRSSTTAAVELEALRAELNRRILLALDGYGEQK